MMSRFLRQAWLLVIGAIASTVLGWLLIEQIERERRRQEARLMEQEAVKFLSPVAQSDRPTEAARPTQPTLQPALPKVQPQRHKTPEAVQPPHQPDDLTQIKGIGPAYARALNEAGVHTFSDLAMQKPAELLKHLNGRISIERVREWIKQAKQLSLGENGR